MERHRERLSTVYFPGGKITMLPPSALAVYSLAAGSPRPALSLYLEVGPDGAIASRTTRIERVPIGANLRHAGLEPILTEPAVAAGRIEHPQGEVLVALWRLASGLETARRGPEAAEADLRPDYSFYVENDRVRIVRRHRGTPVDRIVSELMIQVNSAWGAELARAGVAAIYRV